MESSSFVVIRLQDSTRKVVPLLGTDTVFDLKQRLSAMISQPTSDFVLIFRGIALTDEITLSFYGVRRRSVLFHAQKARPRRRVKPSELYERFCRDLYKLAFSPNPLRNEALLESVLEMLDNPMLQAFSRINPESQFFMKEAALMIANMRESAPMMSVIAQLNDCALSKLEQTAEGIEAIRNLFSTEHRARVEEAPPTNLDYEPALSEEPLPNPWTEQRGLHCSFHLFEGSEKKSKRIFHGNLISTLKAKFAK